MSYSRDVSLRKFKYHTGTKSSDECKIKLSRNYTINDHLSDAILLLNFKPSRYNKTSYDKLSKQYKEKYNKNFTKRVYSKLDQLNITDYYDYPDLFGLLIKSKKYVNSRNVYFSFFIDSIFDFKIEKICFDTSSSNKIAFVKISIVNNDIVKYFSFDSEHYNIYLRYNIDIIANRLDRSDLLSFNRSYFSSITDRSLSRSSSKSYRRTI